MPFAFSGQGCWTEGIFFLAEKKDKDSHFILDKTEIFVNVIMITQNFSIIGFYYC